MAKKKKIKKSSKPSKFLQSLPSDDREHLKLQLKNTLKAIEHRSYPFLHDQADRLREQIRTCKLDKNGYLIK